MKEPGGAAILPDKDSQSLYCMVDLVNESGIVVEYHCAFELRVVVARQ